MRLKKTLIVLICCTMLCGCWDKVEIDRRIFVSIIGVDLGKDSGNKKEAKEVKPEYPFQGRIQQKKLSIIYGFPDISELGPGKAGTAKDQFINVDAASMEDGILEATERSSRSIHLGQTKLIMLSSAVLEDPEIFKEIMDYFERHPNLNKMLQVVVAEGKVEDFVKFKPPMEKNVEYYLSGLMDNTKRNAAILPVTLNEIIVLLEQNGNCIIPKVSIDREKNEINLSGLEVIKDFKSKGTLTPIEVANLEVMRGKLKGGKRVIYKEGHPIDINIEGINRKLKVSGDKDKLVFNIDIRLEGQMRAYYMGKKVFSKAELNSLEEDFSKSISEECNVIAKMLQKEFMVDPIGLREYVERHKPKVWKEIEGKWEDVYNNADINVTIDTKIRRIGVIE